MKILVIVNGQRNSILIHFSNFIITTRSVGLFLDTQVSKCIYVFKRKQKERISRDLSELVNYLYMISYLHICIISYYLDMYIVNMLMSYRYLCVHRIYPTAARSYMCMNYLVSVISIRNFSLIIVNVYAL